MKHLMLVFFSLAGLASGAAQANADLAKSKNCMGCHSIDRKVLGPSFKDISAKYAGQKDAEAKLTQKILKGSSGVWGGIAMPPNAGVSEQEAVALTKWILSQK
jgi:cytochrome c